ncbi:unnamed protein product [Schistosoma margrebowiei]|uniref:Uncharacterized protein n=1 Tax=Schistosoma margrebowiei TaxID=48269 RepID=A0AA85AIM1_9TREM|nr:unnamed protein product [Schistosoma margrebowiei]
MQSYFHNLLYYYWFSLHLRTQKRYYNYSHKFKLWQSIIQTLFSAGNNQVLLSVVCVKSVMGSALFVILMFARVLLFAYVTSVITDHIKDVVLYVVVQGFRTLITVDSVRVWKRIEMVALKLSI